MKRSKSCNFNFSHYKTILTSALDSGYRFLLFEEYSPSNEKQQKANICLLRHDIDYMPLWSLAMAELEHAMGVRSSYFFQIASPTYNMRQKEINRAVKLMQSLGHDIALHYDAAWYGKNSFENHAQQCLKEQKLLQSLIGLNVSRIVSLHCPPRQFLGKKLPGILSTYEPQFFSKIKYLSDSQGWYEGCLCKIFKKKTYQHLQLLIHPYLWPHRGGYDFIKDMANILRLTNLDMMEYMIQFHPVCTKNSAELKRYCKELTTLIQ